MSNPDGGTNSRTFILAIDGPAGVGKSTVARELARRYHMTYIDTGAMYRCVALACQQRGIPPEHAGAVAAAANTIHITFEEAPGGQRVRVDGHDVSADIRTEPISRLSSVVSTQAGVREAMVRLQREMGACGRVVMEGRDIGTVVFPNADLKVFLTASLDERARRRLGDPRVQPAAGPEEDATGSTAAVASALRDRDQRDSQRAIAPLKPAENAIIIETDGLPVEAVVARIAALLPPHIAEPAAGNS